MTTFLKSLWRKLFKSKAGVYYKVTTGALSDAGEIGFDKWEAKVKRVGSIAYDPSEDPEQILKGEFESYFD